MAKLMILMSALGLTLADFNGWGPADATVTKVVSRTAYICPCDDSTSYGPAWNAWEGQKTAVSTPISSELSVRCYTNLGTGPAQYDTSWSTAYTSCTSTVTLVVNTTTTLPASTSTVTSTVVTTKSGVTATVPVNTTITDTVTQTNLFTATSTTTTSTTTTVPTSPGFVPIQSSLPDSSYSGAGGISPIVVKRGLEVFHAARQVSSPNDGSSPFALIGNPNGVTCIHWTQGQCSSTTTISTSTFTALPGNGTKTTITVTSTVDPSATATITTTSTATISTTVTLNSTTTITSTSTIAYPLYAECASNNYADAVNGTGISNNNMAKGYGVAFADASSAYDCCVSAILFNFTSNFVYTPGTRSCAFAYSDCSAGQNSGNWSVVLAPKINYIYGNMDCGKVSHVRPNGTLYR